MMKKMMLLLLVLLLLLLMMTTNRLQNLFDSATGCTWTWTEFPNTLIFGGAANPAATLSDCQSACIAATPGCQSIDWASQNPSGSQCFLLSTQNSKVNATGVTHYDLSCIGMHAIFSSLICERKRLLSEWGMMGYSSQNFYFTSWQNVIFPRKICKAGAILCAEALKVLQLLVGRGGVGVCSVPCNRRVLGSNPPQVAV